MLFIRQNSSTPRLPFRGCLLAEWLDGCRATLIAAPERLEWISSDPPLAAILNAALPPAGSPAPLTLRQIATVCLEHESVPGGGSILAVHEEPMVPEDHC